MSILETIEGLEKRAAENEPTNPKLWAKVQKLTKGEVGSITHNGKTVDGPNDGKGFKKFPSAYANGWAAKIYKDLGGGWKKKSHLKTAGGSTFMTVAHGSNAKDAFKKAQQDAISEYEMDTGENYEGYSGSIAEKNRFIMIEVPEGKDPKKYANELLDEDDKRISDKWGPAGCINPPKEVIKYVESIAKGPNFNVSTTQDAKVFDKEAAGLKSEKWLDHKFESSSTQTPEFKGVNNEIKAVG